MSGVTGKLDPRKSPFAVVLFGVSGCGKSTIGALLAQRLGAIFVEGDDYHSAANIATMLAGRALTDADRWPWLSAIGHAAADQLEAGRIVVIACSALRAAYRRALETATGHPLVFVHLTIEPEILEARMRGRQGHFMPPSLLTSQLSTLEPLRDDETGTSIVETGPPQQTVDAIADWLHLST